MLVYVATEVATIKTCNCDWGDTTTDEKYMQNVDRSRRPFVVGYSYLRHNKAKPSFGTSKFLLYFHVVVSLPISSCLWEDIANTIDGLQSILWDLQVQVMAAMLEENTLQLQ